jgi:opacity protein-like surface antigen
MRRAIGIWMTVIWIVAPAIVASTHAQSHEEPGRFASLTAGSSFGDGDTALALSAGLGWRFSPRIGMDIELAYARKLDFTLDLCPPPFVCVLGGLVPVTGRTLSLVPHLVIDLMPDGRRVRVYVLAGAGAGHVRQRYVIGPPLTSSLPEPVEFTRSNTTVAFSFGGGSAVRISPRFAIGADVRSLHLGDEEAGPDRFITPSGTLSTLRVGSRISWRF